MSGRIPENELPPIPPAIVDSELIDVEWNGEAEEAEQSGGIYAEIPKIKFAGDPVAIPETGMVWDATSTPGHEAYTVPVLVKLLPQKPSRILDVGCGNGHLAQVLSDLGHTVTGIETSQSGVEVARRNVQGVQFEVGSAYDFTAVTGKNPFDVILAVEVVEHLFSPAKFLTAAHRQLAPGGRLILTTPYHGYWKNLALSLFDGWDRHFGADWEGGHIKFFSERSLGQMVRQAGFEQISFHNAGRFPGFWKSLVLTARKPSST